MVPLPLSAGAARGFFAVDADPIFMRSASIALGTPLPEAFGGAGAIAEATGGFPTTGGTGGFTDGRVLTLPPILGGGGSPVGGFEETTAPMAAMQYTGCLSNDSY